MNILMTARIHCPKRHNEVTGVTYRSAKETLRYNWPMSFSKSVTGLKIATVTVTHVAGQGFSNILNSRKAS